MRFCAPEEAGIKVDHVSRFYKELEDHHISTHGVILARGDKIFSECYYAPFHSEFLHRAYSTTKTFVAIAIGFCEQDGLLSLDDPISRFFKEYLEKDGAIEQKATVRELLLMQSTQRGVNWFLDKAPDRTSVYFNYKPEKLAGTLFDYDSSGSYILGVIVEKVTGKPFLDYLREKVLDDIGFSRDAYCLKAPGGHSWGDSGIMCTARDLLLFARFLLNKGTFNGKRYLNEKFMNEATDMKVCNDDFDFIGSHTFGYGYQIWGFPRGCFSTLGMGGQIAFCDPRHDFIFVINNDTQGNPFGYEQIFGALYRNIIDNLNDDGSELPAAPEKNEALNNSLSSKKLFCVTGPTKSDFADEINGVTFKAEANPMGIKWFRLDFNGDEGSFCYENEQGEKSMPFGFGHNVFAQFPEEGYSDEIGNQIADGNTYRAAFSADWPEEKKLRLRVQIIDKYFGNLAIVFGFRDAKSATVRMNKVAEDFLNEYHGLMNAFALTDNK